MTASDSERHDGAVSDLDVMTPEEFGAGEATGAPVELLPGRPPALVANVRSDRSLALR